MLRRDVLRRASWSPYAAGALLGVVVACSIALFGHRLSGAGAYQSLSGYVGTIVAPRAMFWRRIVPPALGWDVLVGLGGVAGAFAASMLSRTFRIRSMPDRGWVESFGPSVARRWSLAFVGSMLTEIGGGLAGGCTASLAVSGGSLLAPAAFVFMAGMFAGGIPVAFLVDRRRPR